MKSEIEVKIEYREIIGEANPGGYQTVRFSRIKYNASPETHIAIRRFQRGANAGHLPARFVRPAPAMRGCSPYRQRLL